MLALLTEHLLRRPSGRPLLLVFEDVYWADPTSRELLGHLVERVATLPVLLVVASRPGFSAGWTALGHVLVLPLDRLGRADGALLAAATAGDRTLPAALLDEILDRTDGVPLFIEELTRAVVEAGLTDAAAADLLPAPQVPEILQDSLMARLDRLGPAKQVAQVASVLGQSFSRELLAAVLPLPAPTLEEALAVLQDAGLLRKTWDDAGRSFAFKHALMREVAYETLLRSRRRKLHARVAEALERRFPGSPPELLAQHHARAGAARAAARCWLRAGELSLRQSAPAEAIAQLGAGVEQLATLPDDAERRRLAARLHLVLGEALGLARGRAAPEVGQAFARALELARRQDDAPELAAALAGLFGCRFHRAELNEARAAAEELLHLAEGQGDAAMRTVAQGLAGSTSFFLGRLAAARLSLEAALKDADSGPEEDLGPADAFPSRLSSLAHLCWTLLVQGQLDEGRRRSRAAVRQAADQPRRPADRAAALFADAVVHQLVGDRDAVLAQAEALKTLAGEQDFPLWRAGAAILHGWSLMSQEGMREMRQGLAAWRATGAEFLVPYFQALLAGACVWADRPAEGLRLVEDGLARAEQSGERWCEAELLRQRGELLLRRGGRNRAAAEAALRRARAVAHRQGAKLWELKASVSLVRLGNGAPRTRRILGPVFDTFTEGFDTPDLIDAQKLLEAPG
jgi:predicted ATPase